MNLSCDSYSAFIDAYNLIICKFYLNAWEIVCSVLLFAIDVSEQNTMCSLVRPAFPLFTLCIWPKKPAIVLVWKLLYFLLT